MRWRNNSSQISLYIKLVLLSLNHIGEDSNATNTLLSMFTEATRYCIINTTGYTPFAPRSFEPPNTTITMCKKLNTVVCGSSDDSQFDVFSMSGLDLIYISLREKNWDFRDILKHIDYNPGENHWKSLTHTKRNLCIKDCELSHDGTSNKGDNA